MIDKQLEILHYFQLVLMLLMMVLYLKIITLLCIYIFSIGIDATSDRVVSENDCFIIYIIHLNIFKWY